jgi:hypothetical protein
MLAPAKRGMKAGEAETARAQHLLGSTCSAEVAIPSCLQRAILARVRSPCIRRPSVRLLRPGQPLISLAS